MKQSTARVDPAFLTALLAPYDRSDAPGFAVGVALRGEPLFRAGVGMASVELPVVLSPTIRMRIGSTSKHFTSLAVMLLAEDGLLSIEDTVRNHLPELPSWAEAMSLRQLMNHRSGMRCSLDLLFHTAGPGKATTPDYHLRTLAKLESVNFPADSAWNYNNGAYALLAEIVARTSGHTFADFLTSRILRPVGMHDTLLRPVDTDLLPNSATLHVPSAAGGYVRGVFGSPISGEGGIVSTVDDMLLWLKHMSDPVVGSPETWRQIRTPASSHGYGLGLISDEHRGLRTIHHGGVVFGGACQMLKVVDHDLDIIVMTNGLGGLDLLTLVNDIIDHSVPDLPPAPIDAGGKISPGIFYSKALGKRLVLETHGETQTARIDGAPLPVRQDADGSFVTPVSVTGLRLSSSQDGESVVVEECGVSAVFDRVTPPMIFDTRGLAGRYTSVETGIIATVDLSDSGIQLTLSSAIGEMKYVVTPIGPSLLEGRPIIPLPTAMLVELTENGFLITTGRTQRLAFVQEHADGELDRLRPPPRTNYAC